MVFFWFTHPMVSWLARFPFFNQGHKLSGLDAETLGIDRIDLGTVPLARGREGLMGKFSRLGNDLYTGKKSDRLRRSQVALVLPSPALIVLLAVGGLYFKGLNMGIEFDGRRASTASRCRPTRSTQDNADELREAVAGTGIDGAALAGRHHLRRRTASSSRPSSSTSAESPEVVDDDPGDDRAPRRPTCRRTRSARAGARTSPSAPLIGLVVFLVLVVLFIWAYFREWKMSVAALVALAHDVLITVGIYALSGLRGLAGHGDRHPDDPRLLALRHRRGLRQGPREHQEPARART